MHHSRTWAVINGHLSTGHSLSWYGGFCFLFFCIGHPNCCGKCVALQIFGMIIWYKYLATLKGGVWLLKYVNILGKSSSILLDFQIFNMLFKCTKYLSKQWKEVKASTLKRKIIKLFKTMSEVKENMIDKKGKKVLEAEGEGINL